MKKTDKNSKALVRKGKTSPTRLIAPKKGEGIEAVRSYLLQISKIPLLSSEEEKKLAISYYETKDPVLEKKLVESNLRFVVKVAAEYSRFSSRLMDLIQEGNIGLIHAVKEFNPYKGARLITYAVWWIKGYIQEFLMRQHSIVRIGTSKKQKKLFYQLLKARRKLEEEMGPHLLPNLAKDVGVDVEDVSRMQEVIAKKDLSFDQPLTPTSSTRFIDVSSNLSGRSFYDEFSSHQQSKLLKKHLKEMEKDFSQKEKMIVSKRFLQDPPSTLQSIADEFKVSREAIRQAEERLMKKIREKLIPILKKPY